MKKISSLGFTMIELLVVISLIAILMTMVIANIRKNKDLARDQDRVSDLQAIRIALEEYKTACFEYPNRIYTGALSPANNGRCPAGMDFSSFLKNVPTDSNGNEYLYVGLSNVANGKCYDYHIAAQMEYDADNNFINHYLLKEDHDYTSTQGSYRIRCAGTGALIDIDPSDSDGLYDVRSVKNNS